MFTLITGASSGIGEEFARQYANRGHSLILVARSEEKLKLLAKELSEKHKISVQVLIQDLSQLNAAEELYNKFLSLGVEINLLINNAGVGLIGAFDSHELSRIQEMLLLNMITLTKLTYLFLPNLKKNRGALLNVASQVSYAPAAYMAAYGATKAYVLNFTQALRAELKDSDMKIMALCPGPTYTKFFERTNSDPNQINFKFRTPQEVVSEAIEGMEKNAAITIPGVENRVWVMMTKLLPHPILAFFSRSLVRKKNK